LQPDPLWESAVGEEVDVGCTNTGPFPVTTVVEGEGFDVPRLSLLLLDLTTWYKNAIANGYPRMMGAKTFCFYFQK